MTSRPQRQPLTVQPLVSARENQEHGLLGLVVGSTKFQVLEIAQAAAKRFGRRLRPIHLSDVMGKYIGETEKNLERIFDVAEAGRWVLFFDEADALFGQRTEVKDSHDRYANVETSYLLKYVEHHVAIVLLATNYPDRLSSSVLKRVDCTVPEERETPRRVR